MSSSFVYCLFLFFSLFISGHFSIPVTISNAKNRVSIDGKILDAHDSKFYYHAVDGLFYWFAASYGDCIEPSGQDGCAGWYMGSCGFRFDHNVTLFVSHNLVDWVNRGVVFQAALNLPSGVTFFAPKTIYNNKTKEWVMWYNYMENGFQNSYYGVAASKNAEGPFRTVVAKVTSLKYQDDGDLNLFVDDDGQGYIIYTSIENNHGMSIERLTENYYLSLGANASSGFFGAVWCEAPMLWKRNGLYYAAFGPVCCYCGSGQIVTAYVATSIFGPYTVAGSLGQLNSQSTDIFIYPDDNGEWQAMYVGDHWQSAPDHVKGHDKTVWAPLFFSEDGRTVKTNGYQDEFTIDLRVKTNDMIAMK